MSRLPLTATLLLLTTLPGVGIASPPESEPVLRSRTTHARVAAVRQSTRPGARLPLRLFADAELTAVLDRYESRPDGTGVWTGHLLGSEDSSVLLVSSEGVLAGRVVQGERSFRIRYAGSGLHRIEELATDRLRPMDPRTVPTHSSGAEAQKLPIPPPKSKMATLDLLVVYTRAAQRRAGGATALRSIIRLQVEVANQALTSSRAKIRFRLVKTKRVAYDESDSMASDLRSLAFGDDGELDSVHRTRERWGADFVSMYVDRPRDAYCGLAYIGWNLRTIENGSDPSGAAFSVVRPDCSDRTLAHELGHNMGLLHAREDYSSPHQVDDSGAFYYSYGYKNKADDNRFYTVMAYRCSRCRPILHFSNPKVRYRGDRTGVGRSRDLAADTIRSVNRIRDELAAYRGCRVDCEGR